MLVSKRWGNVLARSRRRNQRLVTVVAVAAALTLTAGMTAAALGRDMTPPDAGAVYSSSPQVQQAKLVTIIGDSYTAGSNEGGNGPANWVRLVQGTLGDAADLTSASVGGTGYATPEGFGSRVAASVGPNTNLVVFFGSRNDLDTPADAVGKAAAEAYTEAVKDAPNAKLLVIGPSWVNHSIPANLLAIRDQLKAAAQAKGATFVDPLSEGWFLDNPDLIGKDGVHPTDAGHALLAKLIGPHIQGALL